ncbi:MAG: CBS domain-containing protein [Oscillibacter sp.]|nr:CBS domain-containing protein [Oscillibacter sp.]
MNIAFLLQPKQRVAYLYGDNSLRQGLEKMRHHGYTAVPVIDREGCYLGTISEGDFLWQILAMDTLDMKDLEHVQIQDVLQPGSYPPVPITVSVEELLNSAMNQNFIPVVDDYNSFIGLVTRREIISRLSNQKPETLRRIV